ncbi:unnamed protein product [Boreogadus saida]
MAEVRETFKVEEEPGEERLRSRSARGAPGESKQTLPRSGALVSAFHPPRPGGHGNVWSQGPCVNKEQWFNTMGACPQTTPLTDTHTKNP